MTEDERRDLIANMNDAERMLASNQHLAPSTVRGLLHALRLQDKELRALAPQGRPLDYDAARALLEPHRKRATCQRAGGPSEEMMLNFDAAVGIVASLLAKSGDQ